MNEVLFSHNTDDWRTPSLLYDYFINHLGCIDTFQYHSNVNEFTLDRGQHLKLYCNPPFSKLKDIPKWVRHNFNDLHNTIYLLIPARVDTIYFHELIELKPLIYFIKGRLHFNDSKSAPFPTILMVFSHNDLGLCQYSGLSFNFKV